MTDGLRRGCLPFRLSRHLFASDLDRSVIYTEGVKSFTELKNTWWLADGIASRLSSRRFRKAVRQDQQIGLSHIWRLAVLPNQTAFLYATANDHEPPFLWEYLADQDGPVQEVELWAKSFQGFWFLMLPAEL